MSGQATTQMQELIQSLTRMAKTQQVERSPPEICLQASALAGFWNQEQGQGLNPGNLICKKKSNLISILTDRSYTCFKSFEVIYVIFIN